ncbi:MAG: beta-lactamase family protein [Alphaproteobacteria bacterium]|nr:beta-lactamase family protein [Alphaproteobacteria bacterium]HPF46921.1 serine hydrolase domain-containing protein [Emcibacteraceae bacterium]HRW30107.1 serine hydrolase domain-containing protein [Emcibacteraceae bacterium]
MKFLKIIALSGFILLSAGCGGEKNTGNAAVERFDLKKELHDLTFDKNKAPTEIAGLEMILIKNGKIIFEDAEGMARYVDGANVPLTINYKVRIASISKFMLTLAFMTLVEEGKVNLDADISDYLGFTLRNPNFPDRPITARQVLAHISSIRDGSYYYMGIDQNFKDFFIPGTSEKSADHYENGAHFANGENQGPGDFFTYSNLNFGIISGIAENVSGTRMDLFVKERLLDPLGLDASFNVCTLYENGFAKLATLYRRGRDETAWDPKSPWVEQVDGDPIRCYYDGPLVARGDTPDFSELDSYQIGKNPTLFSPQGGLRVSASDLAVIMQMILNGGKHNGKQIIPKSALDKMMTPVWQYDDTLKNGHTGGEAAIDDDRAKGMMITYGLSTHIIDLKDWGLTEKSRILYGHLGSAYGLQGQFWFDPNTNDGIIAFVTGLGDDPTKAKATIPLLAIEEAVLRLGLKGLEIH